MAPEHKFATLEEILPTAVKVVDSGIQSIKSARIYYAAMLILSVMMLLFTHNLELPSGLNVLLVALRVFLVMASAFAVWMAGVMDIKDKNSLQAARADINRLLSR